MNIQAEEEVEKEIPATETKLIVPAEQEEIEFLSNLEKNKLQFSIQESIKEVDESSH